jgi:hypothetical protein
VIPDEDVRGRTCFTKSGRRPRASAAGLIALAVSVAIAALGGGEASAAKERENHCIAPSGVDLNEFYGVSEQIVTPFCTEVGSGERWTRSAGWLMNHSFEVVPEGFVPAGVTPLEDFVAKFAGVRYVVDPGTKRERTYVFADTADLWTGTNPDGFPLVNPLTLGALRPLPPGDHVLETYWRFSAMHCDGLGDATGPGGNCIPAGEVQLSTMRFDVTPAHF